jgi:hypothetical protein
MEGAEQDTSERMNGMELKWIEPLSPAELDAVIRGYTDEKLAARYQDAAKHPGTEWHRLLSAEIGRRDALGRG